MRLPIDPKAEPIRNVSVRPRIDICHPGRPRVITRQQIEDSIHREPDPAVYERDHYTGNFTLRD